MSAVPKRNPYPPGSRAAEQYAADYAEADQKVKERCRAVLYSAEAQGRRESAHHLLFETDMSAEEIIGLLRTLPLTKAEASGAMSFAQSRLDKIAALAAGPDSAEREIETEAAKIVDGFRLVTQGRA